MGNTLRNSLRTPPVTRTKPSCEKWMLVDTQKTSRSHENPGIETTQEVTPQTKKPILFFADTSRPHKQWVPRPLSDWQTVFVSSALHEFPHKLSQCSGLQTFKELNLFYKRVLEFSVYLIVPISALYGDSVSFILLEQSYLFDKAVSQVFCSLMEQIKQSQMHAYLLTAIDPSPLSLSLSTFILMEHLFIHYVLELLLVQYYRQ